MKTFMIHKISPLSKAFAIVEQFESFRTGSALHRISEC